MLQMMPGAPSGWREAPLPGLPLTETVSTGEGVAVVGNGGAWPRERRC